MTAPELRPSASVPPRVFDVIVAAVEQVVINEAEAHGLAPLPREAIVRIRQRCQDAARAVIDVAAPWLSDPQYPDVSGGGVPYPGEGFQS